MSVEYDNYLIQHKRNVYRGFEWIKNNLPELLKGGHDDYEWQLMHNHDYSKSDKDEYEAYDAYFYGGSRSRQVIQDFRKAWLQHIHKNPHHWQHWVLINDEPNEGEILLDMDYLYIIEMVCDWWAFSWSKDNLYEIFNWYDQHKNYMKLSEYTKRTVEHILNKIRVKLDEEKIKEEIDNG